MALCESGQLIGSDVLDASFVNNSIGNVPLFDQLAQPFGGVWVDFVVEGGHCGASVLICGSVYTTPRSAPNACASSSSSHIWPMRMRDVRSPRMAKPPLITRAIRCCIRMPA